MDDGNESGTPGPDSVAALSQRNLSLSEDESLLDSNMDIADEDLLFADIQDDEDDLGSSSELSVSPFEQAEFALVSGGKQSTDSSSKENLLSDAKSDLPGNSEANQIQPTRSSGRLRKEKVPNNQRRNLFPGRPRVTNRGRKFNMNLSDPLASFKSPTSTPISEPLEIDTKLSLELYSNTDDGNSSGVNSALTTPDTSLDASSQSVNSFLHHDDAAIQSNEKITSARKRTVNYPGKIKGKLNNRKKAKLVEYRRKRGSKGRCKSYPAPVAVANFPSNSGASIPSNDVDLKAQDDSNENKMILCSSKDLFVMTQDLCIMCGSLGKDDEGRLLSCSQCGQCYHPFCAGVTKITSIMIKKGWRCLECTVCEGCGKPTDESRLLLCDDCDISYHTYCLDPPLENVPQGTWKCQWCVMCIKCNATTPGYGSQWQANYTLCGPCASQQACSLCQDNYQENDLIIQCVQCSRWLHSKCDSMLDEDECEIASHIGYTCLRCRPSDQLPPHIRARRNGTLRSILNKKRSDEKIEAESTANKKTDTVPNDVPEAPSTTSEPVAVPPAPTAESTAVTNNLNKQSKYHIIDGVYLSDYGLSVIKALTLEQPKKTRGKRKTNSLNEDADHKELDESLEEKVNDLESLAKQNEEERKARQRRLRLEKLGIGGFSVKQRGRLSCNKEEEDLNLELERSGTPDGDKPRRRRRINKKKSLLQESFPSYMQEAFFGKDLLDSTQANSSQRSSSAGLSLSDPETEEDDPDSLNSTSRVSVLDLPPADLGPTKHKSEEINFLDDNFQASLDDDLPPGESFDDLQLSPDDMIMDMLINENLEGNDEVLEELTNGSKIDSDVKDEDMEANFLDGNFNFNDIVDESGLPQMDSKDVEDLFNEVMSDSSLQTSKDFPLPPDTNTGAQLMPKPTVEQMHLANPMLQIKGEISTTHPPVSNVPTPITPLSAGPLASLTPKPYAPTIPQQQQPQQQQPPPVGVMAPYGQPMVNQEAVHQWQNNDTDSESATQGQKNLLKWEAEEALGAMATISPVLYANVSCPHLKTDYPVWSDRLKQISKLWRQLSTDQRQPFLQKARENRAAQRIQKSQTDSAAKIGNTPIGPDIKNEPEQKQWKDLQSPHSNPASVMMADPNVPLQCQRISSPANEMQPFGQISEYGHQGGNQMYPSQQMHPQVKMQSSSPMLLNRPPLTPGPASLQSPMSPMLHSPRLRPTMQGPFPAENYGAQGGQPHQMNMVRPSPAMVSQGSFSPASPSLNQVHSIPSVECYHSSNPSTPQRPQSTDPQHPFGQAASPYGGPPRTPSGMMNPFSPSHHSQMPSHHSVMGNENYSLSSHPTTPQGDSAQSVDMYKVNMTPQHPLSKPHTPDSFVPSLPSSLPSTPQPPSSPQVPTPSPLSDIYARSPATPRSAPVNSQVRPPFDDSYNQRPLQSDLYSPTNTSGSFQQPFMPNNYNMADGFANPQAASKAQIRPNLNPSIRANVPIRRTLSSDPYARQPMTPMPAPSDSHNLYAKQDDTNNDPSKQQLRNLLQVQQIRRPDATPHPRPNWIDNGFRQPLSPAMTRNRMPIPSPNQYSMEQSFRYPPTEQQRMMMQRTPDVRFRQMGPVAHQQQFSIRYPQQMAQTHSPGQQQPQGHSQQVKPTGPQQQWARMAMHSPASSNADMSPMISPNANCQTTQSQANAQYLQHAPNYQQQMRNELNPAMHSRHEPPNLGMHDSRALPGDLGQLAEDENLPVELGDNDDLLELGDDFNILEYADDELPDKALSGHSGKSNIFDELDEKDMLNEKDKEGGSNKAGEGVRSQTDKSIARPGFNQAPFNSPNPISKMGPVSSGQVSRPNKPKANESEQSVARQEQQGYFQNADCLLSDDEFERLKMDFFNDPSEPNHQLAQPVGNALPGQHSQQSQGLPIPSQAQHHQLSMPQQSPLPQQPAAAVQFHQQPHNTQFSQASQVQPIWQGQQPQPGNFPSRMHLRMPANQATSIPRHLQLPSQQPMYGPTPNRMMHHQPQQQAGHLSMATTSMGPIRHPMASIPAPPPPPHEVMNEQDRQQQVQYEQWLIQQNNFIANSQKHLETEVSKLRKMKKSLNAKQRQCRKNQNELNEHDSNELARVSAEIHGLQKTLDQTRKSMRQHNLLIQDYRQKHGSTFNLPHSPGAPTVQTSPRSVNSPLAAMTASGPGTPLGIGPSTPQSPSITSPSPSSLMQNSPMSALHSPAPLMPPSPIHHSPMPNINQDMASMRPQIVQEDNNPFSDVYLQKEKKQHMHQSPVYSHPMSNEMADSRQQMYGSTGYGEDGSIQQPQQYYHPQSQMSYQMGGMRPQQTHPHYPPMNDSANYPAPRFGSPHSQPLNQQYVNQQLNYQQIRRPPPPPYPGKPQHFNARPPYQGNPQIRPQQQQLRPSQECGPMRMQHAMYNEGGGGPMMSSDQYGHNQQVDGSMQHMGAMDPSKNPIVGEAITSMEFNLNELGPGHDNQSDPSSLVQETEEQKPHATSDSASDLQANHNHNQASTSQESAPLSTFIKREIDDTSNKLNTNEEFNASQTGQFVEDDDGNCHATAGINFANETEESMASKQEATRQNALLKQLLQNCPSADLNKVSEAAATNPSSPTIAIEKEIKFENAEKSSCQHAQAQAQEALLSNAVHLQPKKDSSMEMDLLLGDSMSNQSLPLTHQDGNMSSPSSHSTSSQVVEKKMTYLDIRRAQLERDPTPPPEEKPKRKRTIKRKESKSIDESMESTSSQSGGPPITPKVSKKRSRKGSQNRAEETNNGNEHQEHMLKGLINHLRNCPNMTIIEPTIRPNLNVCLPPDSPDFNLKEIKLKGSYGKAYLSSTIDFYSTYPLGPNKVTSVVPTLPPAAQNSSSSHNRAFYYEEFSYMKNIPELADHFKDQGDKNSSFLQFSRDTDSPDTVVSSSSPECVFYDMPPDEYNKMRYINEDSSTQLDLERDCESPILFRPVPIRSSPLYGDEEVDKENLHDCQKVRSVRLNGKPLKETGNVNITLMLDSEQDVRNIILSLAKILKVTSSITYNIEKSPPSSVTDVVEIDYDDIESRVRLGFCKLCEEPLEENEDFQMDKGEFSKGNFCSKQCSDSYLLANSLKQPGKPDTLIDQGMEGVNEIASQQLTATEDEESELMSIFGGDSSDFAKAILDLEGINIDEKRWKNTRYLYWNKSSFKADPKAASEGTEDEESTEQALDKLAICLKPSASAAEKRECIFCHQLGDGDINGASRLLNMDIDMWVHLNCALWSYEVYEMLNGALMNVDQAYLRAVNLPCVRCNQRGASLKCFKLRCNNSYHFPCAVKEKCMFFKDKTILCPQHSPKSAHPNPDELTSFAVARRVFINRDDQKQIATMIHQGDNQLLRIGSLIFLNIGQLLPHQLQSFHTNSYIYPVGYKISRFYWSSRRLGKRCQYICSIAEKEGKPEFVVEIREEGYENVTYRESTTKLVWQKVLEPIIKMREESQTIKVFADFISGEDLFGLTEPTIIRILESLPGVDSLYHYNFKYGRSPWYDLPLAINPTGCARTEPKMRTHFRRPHTLHVSNNNSGRSSVHASLGTCDNASPYVKQFVHNKVSQYCKMKSQWRNNVILARSRIQGIGLYAAKDIEKHTMIIEYIGLLIRNEMAERNERIHEAHNRGIYMFRLDDNRVIDATLTGGLARYINHSCDPNCVAECVQIGNENKILIISNRKISKGEEFTYDYKFEVEDDQHKIPCHCGAVNCRKWMN